MKISKRNIISISLNKVKQDKGGYQYLVETRIKNVIQESSIFISIDNALVNFKEQFNDNVLKLEEV